MVERRVPDFSRHPDLVVVMLGMQVRSLYGLKTLLGLGPQIGRAGAERPDGLLHAENTILFRLFPAEIGLRWYWRDLDSLEAWTRSEPHRTWWAAFLADSGGVGFWHETYHMRGGMEAIFDEVGRPRGFSAFLPMRPARGSFRTRHERRAVSNIDDLPADNPAPPGPR